MESLALQLSSSVNAGTVLALAALGLLVNERAGVINLGAEGMMLVGALAAYATAFHSQSATLGFAAGIAAGAVLAAGFGGLVIWLSTNQYATGLALSLFGGGFAAFAGTGYTDKQLPAQAAPHIPGIPGLADVPFLGTALFGYHPVVYLAAALCMAIAWFLHRSRAGLMLRAIGESPESAHAIGHPVRRIRLAAVMFGGALCGLAGAYVALAYTRLWVEGLTAGRGWIALALTTFATWRPGRVLLGAYLFGAVTMLQFSLQARGVQFGDKIATSFVENVPEAADAERVIRDMVAQGAGLVFGTTFGYMEPMLKVAADAKDVKFEHATGFKTAPNLRTYDSRTYEGAYLVGVIAGGMTRSNVLGVVASIPIPEVIRNINSFTLGAQSVNPAVTTHVVWVNKWFDPPKEGEGAQALINDGADVLMQNTDSSAVLQTAEKAGKFGFGWDSDMQKFGPNAHLASAVIDWSPYYRKAIKDVLDGTWQTEQTWWGVKQGAIDVVSVSDKVPAALKDKLATAKKGLADGSFAIWKGPIADQAGKEVLAASQVADDKFLLSINFYVKGVQGKLPSAQ